jgi:DNA integrity scanning protein DisA with diadenylate cyclase activity
VIGLGDSGDVSGDFELFTFNGHQRWSYYRNEQELLSYKEGKYTYVFDNSKNFILNFPKNFISFENYQYLNVVLHEIRLKKHGTVLIITDDAQSEVERLCKFGRGYAIDPVDFKNPNKRSLLSSIILIDGAIFIDTSFLCYGVGVILDGIAVNAGLSSRGARYNSAQCYIDNQKHGQVTAVVVSDDETIDILYNEK